MPDTSGPAIVAGALIALCIAALAVVGLWRLERSGRSHIAVIVVLALILVDTLLYPLFGTTEGVLDLPVGPGSISLAGAVALAAVAVKLVVPRPSRPLPVTVGMWVAFLAWMTGAAVHGLLAGHPSQGVLNQMMVVLHVGVVGFMAADASVDGLFGQNGLPRLAEVVAPVAGVLGLISLTESSITMSLPGLSTITIGRVGADAATALALLGAFALASGLARRKARGSALLSGSVLLAVTFVVDQRAAWIGTLVTIVILVCGAILTRPGTSSALQLRFSEVLALGAVTALLAVGALLRTQAVGDASSVVAYFAAPFTGVGNQQSADSRLNQWLNALEVVRQHPWIGSGLGQTYPYFEEGGQETVMSTITHNILLDVLLRGGLIAAILLCLALVVTFREGWRVAASIRASSAARAVALGATAALAGLVTKGMVESVFEKHRLAVLLGVCIGLVVASWSSYRHVADEGERPAIVREPGPDLVLNATRRSSKRWT